jgi:hypothetical protein
MRSFAVLPWFVVVLVGCSASSQGDGEAVASRDDQLVGGHVATEAEYPSTVSLGGCTGVKVGPRHFLSAAHCFGDLSISQLSVSADNNAQNFITLTVSSVVEHPEWLNCTTCAGDHSMSDFGLRPDFALITVQELTPDIPVAVLDPTPVAIGDAVTLTGYGCENGVGQPSGPSRLKVGDTHTVDPFTLSDAASIPTDFNTTDGPALDPSSPGLCPGDSGGPLYRTGTNKVVGINALVSFNGDTGTPVGNWHTRLDQQSRYDVYDFITNLINQPVGTPCSDICASPTQIGQSFSSGSLGTGARCFETTANLVSGVCGGFVSPRSLSINNTTMSCDSQNFVLPPKRNGGYCLSVTPGDNSWAWLTTW